MGCVYVAKNWLNGKHYVGFTARTLSERMKEHIRCKACDGNDSYFHRALWEYKGYFSWKVVYQSKDLELLKRIERDQIKLLDSISNGYNVSEGGDGTIDSNGCMVQCITCGNSFIVEMKRYNENKKRGYNHVCSKKCERKRASLDQSGILNSNYKHGKYVRY